MNTRPATLGLPRSVAARRLAAAMAAMPALMVLTSSANAQTYSWNGTSVGNGTYTWSSGTNWTLTPASGADAVLNYTGSLAASTDIVSNNDIASPPFQLNQLNFTNAGPASGTAPTLTLQGNGLEFVNNGSAVAPSLTFNTSGTVRPTIDVQNNLVLTNNLSANATSNARLSGVISGGGNLAKIGNGVLTLAGSNTYTGATTVGGTIGGIIVTSNNALGTTAGNTTLSVGTSLGLSGGVNYSTAETIVGSGGGSAVVTGQFAATLRGLVQSVSGNNTFAGAVQINATGLTRFGTQDGAQLTLSGPITMSGVTGVSVLFRAGGTNGDFITLTNSGNSWDTDTQIFSGNTGGASGVRLGANNTLSTSATLYSTGSTGSGTTLDLAGFSQEVRGLANINGNNVLKITNSDNSRLSTLTLNGTVNRVSGGTTIQDGAGLVQVVKTGTFTQTFNGTNTYTGGTLINQGVLSIQTTSALPGWNTNGNYTVASGATLAVQNGVTEPNVATMLATTNFAAGSSIGFDTTTANRTYASAIANTAQGVLGLNKIGTNTLTLNGTSTYTGNTTITSGTLQVGNGTDAGSIASTGAIINNASLVFNVGAGNRTVGVVVSGSGGVAQNGTGTLTLSGNNTYTGNTTVNAGTLKAGSAQAFGVGSAVTLGTATGATLDLNGNNVSIGRLNGGNATAGTVAFGTSNLTITNSSGTYSGNLTGSGSLFLTGGNLTLAKSSSNYTGNVTVSSGTTLATAANVSGVLGTNAAGTQAVTVESGATFSVGAANNAASQLQNIVINGTGNGGAQAALVSSGMGFGSNQVRGIAVATDASIFVNSNGAADQRGLVANGPLAGSGNLTITGGTNSGFLQLSTGTGSVAGFSGFTGNVNVRSTSSNAANAAGLISNNATALGSTANIDLGSNTYFTVGANQTIGGLTSDGSAAIAPRVLLGTRTLTIGSTNNLSGSFAGVISGTGGIIKQGTGTLSLGGNNTYTGATAVNGGILELTGTGSINNTSGITVNGGVFKNNSSVAVSPSLLTFTSGTIGGTNLSGVTVSIGTNQIVSPGNSPGTLTAGATTFADGGTYVWEINNATVGGQGTKWDLLVPDSLTITAGVGGFTVDLVSLIDPTNLAGAATAFDPNASHYFLFVDSASTISSFSATAFTVDSSAFSNTFTGTWSIKRGDDIAIGGSDTDLYVAYTAIPEPAAYTVVLGLGAIGLALYRRRKTSQKNAA